MTRSRIARRFRAAALAAAALAVAAGAVSSYSTFCGKHANNEATFYVNPNFVDAAAGSAASQIAAIRAAADTWTNDGGADFRWIYGGTTGIGSVDTGDGANAVFAVPTSGGSVLAETWCSTGFGDAIAGFDILFYDGDKVWASDEVASGQFDLEGVACHEMGHALGLGHSAISGATMYPSTSAGQTGLRTIEPDDRAGIQAVYGLASDPPDLTGVAPASGPIRGGNDVVLTGTNFKPGITVSFGGLAGTVMSAAGSSALTVRVPESASFSTVSIAVAQPGGSDSLAAAYTYEENPVEVAMNGTPSLGDTIEIRVYGPPNADYGVALGRNPGPSTAKGLEFCWARDGELTLLGTSFRGRTPRTGPLSSVGKRTIPFAIPNDLALVFSNFYVQGVVDTDAGAGKSLAVTNCLTITIFP